MTAAYILYIMVWIGSGPRGHMLVQTQEHTSEQTCRAASAALQKASPEHMYTICTPK